MIKKKCMLFASCSWGIFARSPSILLGIWKKKPSGTPRAHLRALGVFVKSPLGFGGSGRRSPRKNPNNLRLFDYFTQKNEMTITFSFGTFFSETIVPKSKSLSQVKNVFRTNVVHSLLQNSPVSTINADNKIALKTVSKFQLPNFFFGRFGPQKSKNLQTVLPTQKFTNSDGKSACVQNVF